MLVKNYILCHKHRHGLTSMIFKALPSRYLKLSITFLSFSRTLLAFFQIPILRYYIFALGHLSYILGNCLWSRADKGLLHPYSIPSVGGVGSISIVVLN